MANHAIPRRTTLTSTAKSSRPQAGSVATRRPCRRTARRRGHPPREHPDDQERRQAERHPGPPHRHPLPPTALGVVERDVVEEHPERDGEIADRAVARTRAPITSRRRCAGRRHRRSRAPRWRQQADASVWHRGAPRFFGVRRTATPRTLASSAEHRGSSGASAVPPLHRRQRAPDELLERARQPACGGWWRKSCVTTLRVAHTRRTTSAAAGPVDRGVRHQRRAA